MNVNISGKDYDLHFGLDFLEFCEDTGGMKVDGVNIGIGGFNMMFSKLEMFDPVTVMKVIQGGTNTYKSKPSKANIEELLIEKIESDSYEEFVEEILAELKKQPFTKVQIKKIEARDLENQK